MKLAVSLMALLTAFVASAQNLLPQLPKEPVKSLVPHVSDKVAFDTLDTSNPGIKLILCNDGTWHYAQNMAVLKDSTVFTEYWQENVLNPYGDVKFEELPERVTMCLTDSLKFYACPNKVKVFSRFGMRHGRKHMGVDLPYPKGTPAYAAFNGRVRVSIYHKGGYGNLVIIRHGNGLETFYAHLSERKVEAGDWVHAGDVIGLGGSTGRSTGPHLHFETRYRGFAFDPQWIIDFETGDLRNNYFVLKRKHLSIYSRYYPESEEEEDSIYEEEEKERAEAEKKKREMEEAKYHKIKQGDTLSGIAAKYHTSVKALCRLNGIKETTILKLGKTLRVK